MPITYQYEPNPAIQAAQAFRTGARQGSADLNRWLAQMQLQYDQMAQERLMSQQRMQYGAAQQQADTAARFGLANLDWQRQGALLGQQHQQRLQQEEQQAQLAAQMEQQQQQAYWKAQLDNYRGKLSIEGEQKLEEFTRRHAAVESDQRLTPELRTEAHERIARQQHGLDLYAAPSEDELMKNVRVLNGRQVYFNTQNGRIEDIGPAPLTGANDVIKDLESSVIPITPDKFPGMLPGVAIRDRNGWSYTPFKPEEKQEQTKAVYDNVGDMPEKDRLSYYKFITDLMGQKKTVRNTLPDGSPDLSDPGSEQPMYTPEQAAVVANQLFHVKQPPGQAEVPPSGAGLPRLTTRAQVAQLARGTRFIWIDGGIYEKN